MTGTAVICGVGVCALFSAMLLRELRKEWIPVLLLGFAVLSAAFVLPKIAEAAGLLRELRIPESGFQTMGTILQGLGAAWLTSISAELCRSAGESNLASAIETAGKAELLALSLPLFRELLELSLW